jgi:hypothetical protein
MCRSQDFPKDMIVTEMHRPRSRLQAPSWKFVARAVRRSLDNDPAVDFDSLDCARKFIAERVFGRAWLKIVGGNHLGRRQRIAYDRTQPRFADTIALPAE